MSGIAHGGALDRVIAQHGGTRADWLDLSTGINPVPYPVPAIPQDVWHRLPDEGMMQECLNAARTSYGIPENAEIVAAPGTQALIQRLPDLAAPGKAAIVGPTYGEYTEAFSACSWAVEHRTTLPSTDSDANAIVVCRPNNPDGGLHDYTAIQRLLSQTSAGERLVIIDEAFADVSPEHAMAKAAGPSGLLVLRSFGKFFGLAGIRLGFAIGAPERIRKLAESLGPWAVPGPALYVGAKALRDRDWIEETLVRLGQDSARLREIVESRGLEIVGGTDLFVLAKHQDAIAIAAALARRHILVRTFDYNRSWIRFGLPADDTGFARLELALLEIMRP